MNCTISHFSAKPVAIDRVFSCIEAHNLRKYPYDYHKSRGSNFVLNNSGPALNLFYSYSHEDAEHKHDMQKALALLQSNGFIDQWSDQEILPGQNISPEILEKLSQVDIVVFLFSPAFIASAACKEEWKYAQSLHSKGEMVFRIPIILRPCAWLDFLVGDDVKALPTDGKPISTYQDSDVAWQEIYEGIKSVVEHVRKTLSPKQEFIQSIEGTEFLSQHSIKLEDIYVFPNLICNDPDDSAEAQKTTIRTRDSILETPRAIIHGPEKSGKTALARHLFLSLIQDTRPALLIDLEEVAGDPRPIRFQEAFHDQFHGDFDTWLHHESKTLIVDNMTAIPRHLHLVELAESYFDRIVMLVAFDIFHSFFRDESRLAKYREMHIAPLNHIQQEKLIRTRLALTTHAGPIPDGLVDQVEDRVNSIIISNNILPRYPFFVLSILQTYEGFMPDNMSVTSYGHCYNVLIVSSMIRSGISNSDDEINACFNFAAQLAFATFEARQKESANSFSFEAFVKDYRETFHINIATINRLKHETFGVLDTDGRFKSKYMHYYFLGKYLAENENVGKTLLARMCEASHVRDNYLTILFLIHHTNASEVIDDILLRTMLTLGSVSPATLEANETSELSVILSAIPDNILSNGSVERARREERALKSEIENVHTDPDTGSDAIEDEHPSNDIYRILKNNTIMGQILRNKYGILEKARVQEIIQTIADAGLRLVSLVLGDEDELTEYVFYLHEKNPEWNVNRLKELLQLLSLAWTMLNIREIASAIGVPEIRDSVELVVQRNATPAYDILGYFNLLTNAEQLTLRERDALRAIYTKYNDPFVRWLLSIRTQQYMNTHRGKATVEQSVCSILDVKYVPRLSSG